MPIRVIESQELILIVLVLANEFGKVNMGIHHGGEPTGTYVVGLRIRAAVEVKGADPGLQDGAANAQIGATVAIVFHMAAQDEPLGHVHGLRDFAECLIIDNFDFQLCQEAFSHAAVAGKDIECNDGAENTVSDEFQFLIMEFLKGNTVVRFRCHGVDHFVGILVFRTEYTIGFVDTGPFEKRRVHDGRRVAVAGKNGGDGGVVDDLIGRIPWVVELLAVGLYCQIRIFIVHGNK